MDQPLRTGDLRDGDGTAPSPAATRVARRLVRLGFALGALAAGALVWNLFSAHRADAQLRAATEAQAILTVATTQPQPLSELTELILPGNVQANYEAPIYARTSG
jgi:hypothetical protein